MASIGERLRDARVAQNKSLGDASNNTNISKKYLEALEADDYDAFPAEVYVRGFLRNYAKFLGFDPQEVLEEYNKLNMTDVIHDHEKREYDRETSMLDDEVIGEQRKSRKGLVVSLIIVIIIILAVLGYLYTQNMILPTGGK